MILRMLRHGCRIRNLIRKGVDILSLIDYEIHAAVNDWAFGEYVRTKKWPRQIECAIKASEIMLQLKLEEEEIKNGTVKK